jgi:hypothetical protein
VCSTKYITSKKDKNQWYTAIHGNKLHLLWGSYEIGYINTLKYLAGFQQMVNGLERIKVVTRITRITKRKMINKGGKKDEEKNTKNRKKMNMQEEKKPKVETV